MFELDRLAEYNRDTLITELRRVASLVPDQILTIAAFEKHARVNRSTVTSRFGSWAAALTEAGLADRVNPRLKQLSREEIIHALRGLATRLGKEELTIPEVEKYLRISGDRLRREWGTARRAFEAAGISGTSLGRRYSDEECFDNLLTVWTHYGRPPQYREMGREPSKVGGKAYVKRFGTWNKALAAFVARANAEAEPTSTNAGQKAAAEGPKDLVPDARQRGPRDVPLGLRFKVLRRDNFRCVLCGDNPPANSACVLHVDHIVPWSKGGLTDLDNLRTLCAHCNVGRSNHFTD